MTNIIRNIIAATACRPGEYKPFNSNDIHCQACPANSVSEEPATDVCTCDVTFARPPNEPNEDCTSEIYISVLTEG